MAKRNPAQRLALAAKLRAARGNMGTGRELSASENPKTRLAQAAGKISAGSTQGLGPSNYGGGGGGGVAAPVSTLAGLPQSELLQTLIKNGLIKEGMPAEQALAILKFAQMREGVPIDVAELMKQVSADYAKTSGDILTSGQDWMEQLMGTAYDPNDPNARMFADDPIFSEYAGGMAQLDEVSDANEATDLAWFRKQQASQEAYYNDMMNAISTGTLPVGAAAAGGGGGGGGGRRGGYGGGGGGGGDSEWKDTKVDIKHDESLVNQEVDKRYWNFPGFREDYLAAIPGIAAEYGITDPVMVAKLQDRAEQLINIEGAKPQDVLRALEEEMINSDALTTGYRDIEESNQAWSTTAPRDFQRMLTEYQNLTGMVLGDDPNTPMEESFYRVPMPDDPATEDIDESSILPPNLNDYQSEQADMLRSVLDPAISEAAGGDVGNPEQVSKIINQLTYLSGLAQKRIAEDPSSDPRLQGIANVLGEFKGNTPSSPYDSGGQAVTTAPSGTRYDSGRVLPANVMSQMPDDILAQILPQQVGSQVPGSAIGYPQPTDMGQFDAATQAGTGQIDPLAAGLSPTQRYQNSGKSPDDIAEAMKNLVARNRWSNQPPSIAETPQPGDLPDENGVSHYNVELPPPNVPSGMEVDPVTGEFQPTQAGRTAYEEAMGAPPQRDISFESGGGPLNTVATGMSNAAFGPIIQAIAKMRLLQPQENTPEPPDLSGIAEIMANFQDPEKVQAMANAAADQRIESDVDWFEDAGFDQEDYVNYVATNPKTGMAINPENIRGEYTNRITLDPDTGLLKGPAEHYMQQHSYDQLLKKYPNYTREELSALRNEGEYWRPQDITEEEYEEEQAVANLIPMIQDFINSARTDGGAYNPDVGPATVYSSGTTTARESDALNAKTSTYVDADDPNALPYGLPYDEFSPIEDYEEPDTTFSLGGYAGQSIPLPAGARPTPGRYDLDVPAMLAKSAQNMLAARTTPKPARTSWGGRPKSAYTKASGTNPNIAKAAQAVKGASAIANVLKRFKKK